MSAHKNIAVVTRAYEAFNASDDEALLELLDPDIEFRDLPELPGSGVFYGHDEILGWIDAIRESFSDLRYEPEEIRADGEDDVVVRTRATGLGKGSGAMVEMRFISVWTVRDGRVVAHVAHGDESGVG